MTLRERAAMPTDQRAGRLSPEERSHEIAAILAVGVRRLFAGNARVPGSGVKTGHFVKDLPTSLDVSPQTVLSVQGVNGPRDPSPRS